MTKTILIVDDENETQRLVKLIFGRAGYEVVSASSTAAALNLLGQRKPDVVIVDDLLPGVSGLELCQQITSNPSTRQIPVIILSAGTEQIPQNALASVGAFAALRKPFEPRKLLNTVEASLGAHV